MLDYFLIYADFASIRPVVEVETLYFVPSLSVENARQFIIEFMKMCASLFPSAKTMEALFNGVLDRDVGSIETYSKKLWRKTKIGTHRTHDRVIVMPLRSFRG